jgi:RHS repeat-associated protein
VLAVLGAVVVVPATQAFAVATVPGAPTAVSATPGNSVATVSWTAPASNGGTAITGYTVTSSPGGFTAATTWATSTTVSGLSNGTAYTFTVTATNSVGTGAASAASSAVTPLAVPGVPTAVSATAGDSQASVSWTAPASNGGTVITGYTVTSSPGGFTASTTGATSATVTGLTNGTGYTFTVTATNAVGTGSASTPSGTVIPAGALVANSAEGGTSGTTLTVSNSGGGSGNAFTDASHGTGATLVYSTSAAAHGLLGYALTGASGTSSSIGWNTLSTTSAALRFYYNPGSTLPSTTLRLADIRNSSGTAARIELSASNQLFVQNTAGSTIKTFPTALLVNTWYRIEFAISVSATAATINAAYYPMDSTTPVDPVYTTTTGNTGSTNITQTLVGSVATATWTGTSYFDDVAAQVNTTTYIGPSLLPGAPQSVTATPGNTQATVSWAAPVSSGSSPITGYTVTSSPGSLTATTTGATSATVTGLTNGTAYTFTVTAKTLIGAGAASSASSAVTPATVPGAPTGAAATAGNAQASVSWTAPSSTGGSPITGYTVTSSPGSFTSSTTGATSATVIGLSNGTAYTFTVTATNAVGTSVASSASAAVTPVAVPGAPTAVSGTPGDGQASVSWTAPASNGGTAITGYTVTSTPGGFTATTTGATSATVTGLTDQTGYTFTVTATNAVGTSSPSAASGTVTPVGALVANSAEGGTAGTTVTASNSGGGSGNAFTDVSLGTGAALVYSTAAAEHGSLGYALTGTSGTSTFVGWNTLSTTSAALRFYYNPGSTLPSTAIRLADIRDSAGTAARIVLSASNQLLVQNTAGTTITTFPTALSAHTWYRIEIAISVSATAATINAAYYPGDSSTPVDPVYATTTGNTGTTPITQVLVGSATSATWTGTSDFDDIATRVNTTTYIGPSLVPGAPQSVTATPGNGQATLTWAAPAGNGSPAITGYTVTSSPGGLTATTTGATSATVSGLYNQQNYTFTVTATNASGTSAGTTSATVTVTGAQDASATTTVAVDPGAVTSVAGSGVVGTTTPGTGTGAQFDATKGVLVVGGVGYVAAMDTISKVNLSTGAVTAFVGTPGSTTSCATSTTPTAVQLESPSSLTSDGTYLYYVTCGAIWRTSLATGATSVVVTLATASSVTVGPTGTLYVTNGTSTVYQLNPATGALVSFATLGTFAGYSIAADATALWVVVGPASTGTSVGIDRVALAGGTVTATISDTDIWEYAPLTSAGSYLYSQSETSPGVLTNLRQYNKTTGAFADVAGSSVAGFSDGTGTDAWVAQIYGIASDGTNLWIVDNDRLRKVTPGTALPSAQDPLATTTVAIDPGSVSTFAGSGTVGPTTAGTGTGAQFDTTTSDLVVGGVGYVASADAISKVNLSTGAVTPFIGQSGTSACMPSPTASLVEVQSPASLVSDGYYLYYLNCGGIWRTSLATGATSIVVAISGYASATIGPGGTMYVTNGSPTVYKLNPANDTLVAFANLGTLNGYAIASDATALWVVVGVTGASNGSATGIDRVTLAGGSVTAPIADSVLRYSSPLVSTGGYLYAESQPLPGYPANLRQYTKATSTWVDVAGSGQFGYQDGTGTNASFNQISGIASDGTNLWVTDNSDRLREVQAIKAPLAGGGPTRPGESWGCGPSSENATQPACTDFVDPGSGAGVQSATDFSIASRGPGLQWSRAYDSQATAADGPLGHGWADNYSMAIITDPYNGTGAIGTSPVVDVVEENGSMLPFVRNVGGTYSAPTRVQATLVQNGGGSWTFTRDGTQIFGFNSTGQLTTLANLDGYQTTLTYTSGQLTTVTDEASRTLTFTYWSSGKVKTVTDPLGRVYQYAYDSYDNLTTVTDPEGLVTTYGYDSAHDLTSVVLPLGQGTTPVGTTTVYDAAHRVTSHTDAMGHTTGLSYSAPTAPGSFTETRTDPTGAVTVDVYSDGELMSSTAAYGTAAAATTSYTYDPVSNGVTSVTDPDGHVSHATFDVSGNTLTSTDANGHTTTYTYNSLNEVLTKTDPLGVTTTNTYDTAGNLLTTSTPLNSTPVANAVTSNTYGDALHPGDITASTDANNKITHYTYDSYGNQASVTDPLTDKTTATYDADGEMLTQVAADGNVTGGTPANFTTTTTYWTDGQKKTITDPLGHVTSYAYDADGNPYTVTDATSLVTTTVYNDDDQLASVTNPDGTSTTYGYDGDGRKHTVADGASNTTTYGYDLRGDLTSVQDPAGNVSHATFDLAGRKLTSTTANSDVTSYSYDNAGQLLTTTNTLGVTTDGYDADGHNTTVLDPDNNLTTYDYDSLGRQTTTHRPDGTTVVNGYDLDGQLTSYTDGATKVTSYVYNDGGEKTSSTDPDLRVTHYGYDASGQQTTTTDATSRVTTNVYDDAGRLTNVNYSDGVTHNVTYTYDNANRPLTMVDGTGTTTYGHDAYGRVNSVTNGASTVVGYGYDSLGRIHTITYPGSHVVTRGYDADSRLTSVTDWNSNQTTFGYDADSNLTTTTYPNGVVSTNTIGSDDDISGIVVAHSGTTLASFGYTYTPSNLVASRTDSLDPTSSLAYGYNTLHQLVGLNTATAAYAYDHAGNLTTLPNSSTISYDAAGQAGTLTPTSGPSTTFGFDGVGERTSAATSGSPTVGYTYNQAGDLTGSTNTPGGNASYSYNGNGLRASTTDTAGTHASTWDVVTASLPLLLSDGTNDYLYGPNDKPIEQINISVGTTTYLQQDREGSTRLITNSSGAVVATKSYDAYGNVVAATGTATSPFGYTGEYTDFSGLIYLRARYYDPATAQLLTRDPDVGATHAPYTYAGGNPVNLTDPTGERPSGPDPDAYGYATDSSSEPARSGIHGPDGGYYYGGGTAAAAGGVVLYRTMKIGTDGGPQVSKTFSGLGARTPRDITPDPNDMVHPGKGGMTMWDDPMKIGPGARPPGAWNGTGAKSLRVYEFDGDLPEGLVAVQTGDPGHYDIQPAYTMPETQYQDLLASMGSNLRAVTPDDLLPGAVSASKILDELESDEIATGANEGFLKQLFGSLGKETKSGDTHDEN